MAKHKTPKRRGRRIPPLSERFTFLGDAVSPVDRKTLRSAQFEVSDARTGQDRILKLWAKTGTSADEDLRQLWLHEMRQVQRVMSYAGAREVIVDILEFVEDEEEFGVVLEHAGQPLSAKLRHVPRQHWLKNIGAPRARVIFWQNMRRIAIALGIVHAQGLVHGRIDADAVMTEGAEIPEFQLTGFEWSLWLSADKADRAHARLNANAEAVRSDRYSFAEDWRSFGRLAAQCLEVAVRSSGEIAPATLGGQLVSMSNSERALLRRLVAPTRLDNLEAGSIARAIDDIVVEAGRAGSSRAGTFVLMFSQKSGLGDVVYDITGGDIPNDEYRRQLDWVRADLDRGATLLVPRAFDPTTGKLQLVSSTMVYDLTPMWSDGVAAWDVAVCSHVSPRGETLRIGDQDEHELGQPIEIATSVKHATEVRARLGPDALVWTGFAEPDASLASSGRADRVRQALLLVQIVESVIKSLEVYPVEVLQVERDQGRRFAVLRAEPRNERDRAAAKLRLPETERALRRLFEDDQRDADAKWRLSLAASLGSGRQNDVLATFLDVVQHKGRHALRFELDDEPPQGSPLFLRPERDTGTENAITRRLKNIKALSTCIDLSEMLDDPWRVRRSSRETIDEAGQKDEHFLDLDPPKQQALLGAWSTSPSYNVVGPPGVGKTRLATEVVRRRFEDDRSSRLLITAQGHDALDHLQSAIRKTLATGGQDDVIIVRSTTPDRRSTSDEDLHKTGRDYLALLSESELSRDAPPALRDRVNALTAASGRLARSKDAVEKDDRVALNALSSLILDAANIVISTANSADVERLVEASEQFDWVIVEEAAKATGPELVGALMLSGRRLMIGDHHQLPPFEADRLVALLRDHSAVVQAIEMADQYVGPLMRDGEIAELEVLAGDPDVLRDVADTALRLFEPFRTFVEEDERRARLNPGHRPISSTLTSQRRMDPAIARIVSRAFYHDRLTTTPGRTEEAVTRPPPFDVLAPLPPSPVVAVEFKHVSATGDRAHAERSNPRWHNPGEVQAVIDVLRHVRAREYGDRPTLAVLSFYSAQVEKLAQRIEVEIRASALSHLAGFAPAMQGGGWVGTVDGFQGNEADLVILSLVRNNAGSGTRALGFLRDRRRMNVALSRAKSKLVIVGSPSFLVEAVRGVNPDAGDHDLSFIDTIVDTVDQLKKERRPDGTPCAASIDSAKLSGGAPC